MMESNRNAKKMQCLANPRDPVHATNNDQTVLCQVIQPKKGPATGPNQSAWVNPR